MFEITVQTKKGTKVGTKMWDSPTFSIGRNKSSDLVLQGWRVAKNHAVFQREADEAVVACQDGSIIFHNGKKLSGSNTLSDGDLIIIGDYQLQLKGGSVNTTGNAVKAPVEKAPTSQISATNISNTAEPVAVVDSVSENSEKNSTLANHKLLETWRSKVHKGIFDLIDLRRVNVSDMSDEQLRMFTGECIDEIIAAMNDFPEELVKSEIAEQVLAEAVGLGPLDKLIAQENISEIMVNAHDQIFYEQSGQLKLSEVTFTNDQAVLSAIERIVTPLGRRIDESSPLVDARLKDGSRVNAVIPPLALKGPSITIRKFMKHRIVAQDLINFGSVDDKMVTFLESTILRKKNVVVSGGTGSGKTTLLNVMSNYIPDDERIVTVEDAAELKLYQPNLVALEARPANQEGKGAVSIRELVKNCLRMRPDRIVVGECRGGEALDMLQAMNTGHDGSLTTVHSNSPRDCISRLEILVLMSGMDLPVRAIRDQIASAVDIIVQQTRFSCGSRRITSITEVTGVEGETVQLAEIFHFKQDGYDENGKVLGRFLPTGIVPEFYEELRRRGIDVDMSIFTPEA